MVLHLFDFSFSAMDIQDHVITLTLESAISTLVSVISASVHVYGGILLHLCEANKLREGRRGNRHHFPRQAIIPVLVAQGVRHRSLWSCYVVRPWCGQKL